MAGQSAENNTGNKANDKKKVVLALQGGAAHGAFVWGVLDRLLDDERLEIEGVSGTSSGAVNAALLASGMIGYDPARAQKLLETFWRRLSDEFTRRRWSTPALLRLLRFQLMRVARKEAFFDVMSRVLLPYHINPKTMNPLRKVIGDCIDFERLRADTPIKLFINATNIATNANRIFDTSEISLDAVCASCCLPFLFDAVEIDGEHYWDGGYIGNPTIYPLIYECQSLDVIMVLTSSLAPKPAPKTSADILNRISEVSFKSAFMREMRAISFVTDLLENGHVAEEASLRKINVHVIAPPSDDLDQEDQGAFNAKFSHFETLRDNGRAATQAWLDESYGDIGVRSSFDLKGLV